MALPATDDAVPARVSPKRFAPVFVLLAVGLAYAGYTYFEGRKPYEWSGTVEAHTVKVGSRVGGRVKSVLVREGQRVKEGEALVELEPGDLEAQRLVAEGALEQAQATLEKLEKGARPEEIEQAKARAATATASLEQWRAGARKEEISVAEARLLAAQVTADKAQLDADRAAKLVATGAVAQAEADATRSALLAAQAQRDAARDVLAQLRNGARREEVAQAAGRAQEATAGARLVTAGARVEDIKAARGAVMGAQGRLDTVRILLGELVVRAPRTARVEALPLRPGDLVSPNGTAATLIEDEELYVRIYVPETRIGLVKEGASVPVSVDSFPGRFFRGVIEHVNDVGEYSPRNVQTADERAYQVFATKVRLDEGRGELRAGMAAFIQVPK